MEEQIGIIAAKLQKECHKVVEGIIQEGTPVSYQDATNIYLFTQLAILQYRIDILENPVSIFK